jgi:hypothetical protein
VKFWASTEVFKNAFEAEDKVRRAVQSHLNVALANSNLASFEAMLRYVPVVMPEGMRQRYPARSKLRKKERIYDCAPQLNYDVFVSGSFEAQLREYLQGLSEAAPHLAKLGATPEQINEFNLILAAAVERILLEQPHQTRH